MATPSRSAVLISLQALARGVKGDLGRPNVTLAGKTYSMAQILARVNNSVDSALAVRAAQAALKEALLHDAALQKREAGFLAGLRALLQAQYAHDRQKLAAYGLAPKKPKPPPSAEQELLRIAKLRATREKRQTRGKRQTAAIRGDVTGVLIEPIVGGKKPGSGA
jgi:hypothetical protein